MPKKLLANYPIVFLLAISLFLCFANYTPNTFLSGWDTLHPEFNFGLNFQRVINGTFRTEQGLGALAIHSHMADLPHIFILFLTHFFLPLNLLRYFYIFLQLIIGPIGIYFFIYKFITKNKPGAFLGALFYLLNLGTLQQFFVPFEMFTVQFAALPWLFYLATEYLDKKNKPSKALIYFFIASLFSSPMAYAATLWYFYFLCLLIYVFCLSLSRIIKKNFSVLKKILVLICVTITSNSYWILPNLYAVFTKGAEIGTANINKLFSEQAFLYNKEFGNALDISLLKTFYFDWGIYAGNNKFNNLLLYWIDHLNNPFVLQIGLTCAMLGIIGIIYSIYLKNKVGISFLPILFLCIFFLINDNFPTGPVYIFLQNHLPLFKEALRFPGDKVLGLYTLVFAVYFSFSMQFLYSLIKKAKFNLLIKTLNFVFVIGVSVALIYYMLPAFKGQLISPYMRVSIPNEYFKMFNWFNSQKDEGRIAHFPVNSLWGWEYYKWYEDKPSFQGAGFIWFGIKQPMLVRDFDRWNLKNEQFYKELSHAVYSNNSGQIKNLIDKYQLKYLLLDKNIIAPENSEEVLFYAKIEKVLKQLEDENVLKKETNFGKIYIYKTKKEYKFKDVLKDLPNLIPVAQNFSNDFGYEQNGNYFSSDKYNSINYQFRNINDNQEKVLSSKIDIANSGIKIKLSDNNFLSPALLETENKISASVLIEKNKNNLDIKVYPLLPYQETNKTPIPLTTTVDISKNPNFVLSINNYNFSINNLEENLPIFLGNVFLNTKDKNTISVYSLKPDRVITPDFSKINFSINPCLVEKNTKFFGVELEEEKNSFSVFAKKIPLCITIPLRNIISDSSAFELLLSSDYDYRGKAEHSFCLASLKNGSCLDYISKNITQGLVKPNLNYFGINKNDLENLAIKIQINELSGFLTEKNTFNNFLIGTTEAFYSTEFSKEFIEKSISGLKRINSQIITIPFSGDNQLSSDITKLPITDVNCKKDPFSINNSQEKNILKEQSQKYIRYSSTSGSACDHFSYSNLPTNQAYLISIESRNVSGLPMTLCVLNQQSKHCDIYANLTKSPSFARDIFLLPPMADFKNTETGYDISFSNLGIKGTKTINDLKSIQIIPIPYRFLSSLKTEQLNTKKEIFTFFYTYDKGWNAYKIENNNFWQKIFPFLFGKKLNEHVLVNNWANGWVLNNSSANDKNSEFVVIYLPQYLEYLGFLMLIVSLITLIIKSSGSK